MNRRKFIKNSLLATSGLSLAGLTAWHHFFDGEVFNPCSLDAIPDEILNHELMAKVIDGIDFNSLWDCHFHLIGNGLNPSIDNLSSGGWLSPKMTSWSSPMQKLQYEFYLNAGCINNSEFADKEYMQAVIKMAEHLPKGIRFMLLAFDYQHDEDGKANQPDSTFYMPNEYAARMAKLNPLFEWIASIHPYREDAVEHLQWCVENGARAVKWLPPAMNIDPASEKCNAFYDALVKHQIPLLTHAGDEKAVHSEELQKLANPLLLRKPLEMGVNVIVAHCASLGEAEDIESNSQKKISNFNLFARLMEDSNYKQNLLGDISAINLFNRNIDEVKQIISNQHWHERLLYASDFPLPGVMPIVSSTNLASHHLLSKETVEFLSKLRLHNSWLFDFAQKRLLEVDGISFSNKVFSTRHHFTQSI